MAESIFVNLGKEYELKIGLNAQRRAQKIMGKSIGEAMRAMPDIDAIATLLYVGIKEFDKDPRANPNTVADALEAAMEAGQTDLATILDALNRSVGKTWGGQDEKKP